MQSVVHRTTSIDRYRATSMRNTSAFTNWLTSFPALHTNMSRVQYRTKPHTVSKEDCAVVWRRLIGQDLVSEIFEILVSNHIEASVRAVSTKSCCLADSPLHRFRHSLNSKEDGRVRCSFFYHCLVHAWLMVSRAQGNTGDSYLLQRCINHE